MCKVLVLAKFPLKLCNFIKNKSFRINFREFIFKNVQVRLTTLQRPDQTDKKIFCLHYSQTDTNIQNIGILIALNISIRVQYWPYCTINLNIILFDKKQKKQKNNKKKNKKKKN